MRRIPLEFLSQQARAFGYRAWNRPKILYVDHEALSYLGKFLHGMTCASWLRTAGVPPDLSARVQLQRSEFFNWPVPGSPGRIFQVSVGGPDELTFGATPFHLRG